MLMSIPLTVESLAGGGAVERLHKALGETLENILDPNTDAKKVRKVKLELSIKPNENRDFGEVTITTTTSLQPPKPIETSILIDRDKRGKAVAAERMVGEGRDAQPLPGLHPDGKITAIKVKEA
jgi:hypothetical protein